MQTSPSRHLGPLAVGGALLALGLVSASRMYFGYAERGRPISLVDALGSGMLEWWLWAPLLPVVRLLARRFPLRRAGLLRPLTVHLVACAAAALLQIVLFGAASAAIRELRFGTGSLRAELAASFLFKFHTGVVVYWTAALAFLAWDQAARSRTDAVRRAELERSLAEARLAALQSQLSPHFLFNTLNAVSAVLRDDPDRAEGMLASLGDLLRAVLARRDRSVQTLAEELAFLEDYLDLQRGRFGDRLTVEKRVDPDVLDAGLPSFLLLPLVENAVQHGIGARPGNGTIRIEAVRSAERVEVTVADDGPGIRDEAAALDGRRLGLESVRERLRLLYGDDATFEVGPGAPHGATIRLGFPRRPPVWIPSAS